MSRERKYIKGDLLHIPHLSPSIIGYRIPKHVTVVTNEAKGVTMMIGQDVSFVLVKKSTFL